MQEMFPVIASSLADSLTTDSQWLANLPLDYEPTKYTLCLELMCEVCSVFCMYRQVSDIRRTLVGN